MNSLHFVAKHFNHENTKFYSLLFRAFANNIFFFGSGSAGLSLEGLNLFSVVSDNFNCREKSKEYWKYTFENKQAGGKIN